VSDYYHCRGFVAIISSFSSIIGFTMFLASSKHHIQYASLFFSIPGAYVAAPTLATWSANNASPHTRRATAIAISFIMTNSGGILATWLLGTLSQGPRYLLATRVMLTFSILMVVFIALNILYLWDQNKKKAAIRMTSTPEQERPGLGDKSAWFIYSL
jgi:sugar phosphate permease